MKRLLLLALVLAIAAMGGWAWTNRDELAIQLACYRVRAAANYEAAVTELEWFEKHPRREQVLQRLMARFGTGNRRLDEYLTSYAYDGRASEAFRQALSLEFAWRPELLPLWQEYWTGRQQGDNLEEEVSTIRNYLEALDAADPPREVTWRDILDIQAAMQISDAPNLAIRLSPRNWRSRYHRWAALSNKDHKAAATD